MQAVIDLTPRQASRVLEQALRTQGRFEIEPRTRSDDRVLAGSLVGQDGNLLRVDLDPADGPLPPYQLIGAFCDVRTVLMGQLYLFSTCIVDVVDRSAPVRLILALPETMYVANRRRFERQTLAGFSQVRLWPTEAKVPYIGELCNISGDGLACRMIRGELDELLFVGDEARVQFEIRQTGESFDLPVTVCNKTVTQDTQQLIIGLEFVPGSGDATTQFALEQLRAALCELATNLNDMEMDGGA